MSIDGFDEFMDSVDWEATEKKHEDRFWSWALENGKNEDYILDNPELFADWAIDYLDESEYVYVS